MKKHPIIFLTLLGIIVLILGFMSYQVLSGNTCRSKKELIKRMCLPSKYIQVEILNSYKSYQASPFDIVFFANITGYNTAKKPMHNPYCFNEQWHFGDDTEEKITPACADGALPSNEKQYEKQHTYAQSGTYKIYVKLFDQSNKFITKSNTITVTVPGDTKSQ